MTPQEAFDALTAHLGGPGTGTPLEAAWRALDRALRADGVLPYQWERLTSSAVGERVGKPPAEWGSLAAQGYAPPPDGHDHGGRAWWHPATIDAWRTGEWTRTPRPRDPALPPPGNASSAVWRDWAQTRGVAVTARMPRQTVIQRCEERGVL